MANENININWSENVILVDGDYIDKVAFNLIVNFERMLERRIPEADLAHWLDCIALDGGMRPNTDASVSVIFLHSKEKLQNFSPSRYQEDIHEKAFKDDIAEFAMAAYKVEDIISMDEFFTQTLDVLRKEKNIKRLMVIPNAETYINKVRKCLANNTEDETSNAEVTVFAMEPVTGNFRQEILGYSIMQALGITSEELDKKLKK